MAVSRAARLAEFLALFVAAPLLMRIAMFEYGVPLFWALGPVLALLIALAVFDRTLDWRAALGAPMPPGTLRSILVLFALGAPFALALVAWLMPEQLFNLPRERTKLWAKMLVLYPFTSVLAQEVIYRVIFFHRYAGLFRAPWVMIALSAAVFALSHIVFRNWLAVGLSLGGGVLFAWRYHATRSFLAVWVEHTLWGWLLFTCGPGIYFLPNSKNPAWG